MKEFATKKIESLKKTWIWNGTIDAISLTFMNQCTALGSKLQYMALSKTNDLASKIGTFFLLAMIIAYLILVYLISFYVRWI